MDAKVSIVILNYKVCNLTLECVESVLKSDYKNLQVIVVDNNSNDGLDQKIKKFRVEFIQNNDNLGYAGGNNVGIEKALKDKADFVFVLNPDTTIQNDTIKILVEGMQKYNAGLANPKIYFSDSKKLWFAGKKIDLANVLASHRGVDEEDVGKYDDEEEIEDGTGAALMVKREVFETIGLFDERYFLYYEESDFCFRARKKGFKIMYLPKAVVFHANAKSTGLGSPLQDYFITRNRMLFASKFLPLRTRFALFREGLRNFGNPTRRLAFFDFLTGNFGKGSFLK